MRMAKKGPRVEQVPKIGGATRPSSPMVSS